MELGASEPGKGGRKRPRGATRLCLPFGVEGPKGKHSLEGLQRLESVQQTQRVLGCFQQPNYRMPTCGRRGVLGASNRLILSSRWAYWWLF